MTKSVNKSRRLGDGRIAGASVLCIAAAVFLLPWLGACGDSEKPSANNEQSFFGVRVFEETIALEPLFDFRLSGNHLVVRTGEGWTEDTRVSIYRIPTGELLWTRTGACHYYELGTGQHGAIALTRVTGEGIGDEEVFDLDGTLLFSKADSKGGILTSPNGEYFCTQYSHTSVNSFIVYDRNGNELHSRRGTLGEWYVEPVTDSTIALFSSRTVSFLLSSTGDEISKVDWPLERNGGYPTSVVSQNGGWMIADMFMDIGCFSPAMDLAWHEKLTNPYHDVAFSDDERFAAILTGRDNVYKLELRDAQSGTVIWSEEIRPQKNTSSRHIVQICFAQEFISVRLHGTGHQSDFGEPTNSKTYLFRLDETTNQIAAREYIDGIVSIGTVDNQVVTLSVRASEPQVLQIEGWKQ